MNVFILKRIKPDIKIDIAGDLNLLAPIDDRIQENIIYVFDYKNSIELKEICNNNKLELNKC